jgi:hypothetical protein
MCQQHEERKLQQEKHGKIKEKKIRDGDERKQKGGRKN